MNILVKKFGGSSLSNKEKILNAAKYVQNSLNDKNNVIVVVSAMGNETDNLLELLDNVDNSYPSDEYDSLVSSGEQISSALFSLLLRSIGIKSRSYLGWQIPIFTTGPHSKAKIQSIETKELIESIKKNEVPVIAGFQGVNKNNRITTLGRGGSDTSAVAIAASVNAKRCDIYTDVEGVYTADPRIVHKARKMEEINFEEMLELSSLGAKVLQTRSVQLALKYNVNLQVLSSTLGTKGTMLVKNKNKLEENIITGIAHSCDEAKVTLLGVRNNPGISALIFGSLASANINVDMIVQSGTELDKDVSFTFTVPKDDSDKTKNNMINIKSSIGFQDILVNKSICKVSVVGLGMKSHVGVANKMFSTLAKNNINILVISTSEIKISVLIDEKYKELALRSLHSAFELNKV